jgi:hypothetical protein
MSMENAQLKFGLISKGFFMDHRQRKIKKSQLITPFGVGAVVPFPNDESLIIGGIDNWNTDPHFEVKDERLAKRVGVSNLYCPPEFIGSGTGAVGNAEIPAFRFPTLYYCAKCGFVTVESPIDQSPEPHCPVCMQSLSDKPTVKEMHAIRLLPERFVVVCPNGHLSDFPVAEFVHQDDPSFDAKQWYSDLTYRLKHRIFRKSSRNTSSLAGISFHCSCNPGKIYNMAGMTQKGALKGIMDHCLGKRPWLGESLDEKCNSTADDLLVVQRGGTNVWFPQIITSIYLPAAADKAYDPRIVRYLESSDIGTYLLGEFQDTGGTIPIKLMQKICEKNSFDFESFLDYCVNFLFAKKENKKDVSEDDFRFQEYNVLSKTYGDDASDIFVKNSSIFLYNDAIRPFFQSISIVEKMKETRALVGFSRLAPQEKSIQDFRKTLSDGSLDWVPAVQTQGEGIFIAFNKDRIIHWRGNPEAIKRAKAVDKAYQSSLFKSDDLSFHVTPEYLLIHTFSHILISSFSRICGYGSSSLRERLYCSSDKEHEMYGVLIYTTSGSSEGSLGGLIKQGTPGHLEDIILSAIEEARWCSYDPICIDSKGQGPDSCNLAACHNCALLPETSCEKGNRFLDRGCLIGIPTDASVGYFNK